MKSLLWLSIIICGLSSFSSKALDLEVNMKNTGLAYKQSVQATNLDDFNTAIDEFIELVQLSKTATFHQHEKESLEGLDKVIKKATVAKRLANEKGLDAAKGPLKSIDGLRKRYHELHEPPSFFEMLFQ